MGEKLRGCRLVSGFIEPLEASSIALIEQAAHRLCQVLPLVAGDYEAEARAFNEQMNRQWAQVEEFLQCIMCLANAVIPRTGETCGQSSVSCPAQRKAEKWRRHPVWHADAPRFDELFPSASYQYVLYGMLGRHIALKSIEEAFSLCGIALTALCTK